MCHQKSGSVTGWMAAISSVRKMAMVKKCGRSSHWTARLSHRSGPGWSGNGAGERARVANLQDEGNEPAGVPSVGLVLRVGAPEHPLLEMGADDLGGDEKGEHHHVQAEQGWQHQAEAGDDLSQVDRMAGQLVGSGGHQAARLRHDAEASPEIAERVQRPDDAAREAHVAAGQYPDVGTALLARDEKESVEDEAADERGRDGHRVVIASDGPAAHRIDHHQKAKEGQGENSVEEIHRLGPVQGAVERVLDAGVGQLTLNGYQEAKDADGQRPSDDEGRPVIHLVWRFSVNSSIFLLSLGRQTGLLTESNAVFRSPSSPI